MTEINDDEKAVYRRKIDEMTGDEMARLWRFAPVGHPIFDVRNGLVEYFEEKFREKGGWTPERSKRIGQ